MSVKDEREHFNAVVAPTLAASVGVSARVDGARSSRFAYFADHSRFVVVAGAQEGSDVDLAFAFGITYRGDHRLVLVLPEQFSFPTMQRAPWFRADVMPDVWLHDGVKAWPVQLRSQAETIAELAVRLKPGQSFEAELREAATPVHLGARSAAVAELAEWATTHPLLDAGHRKGERAWHCMGQKVLSIKPTLHGLSVVAGIHYSKPDAAPPVDEVTIEGGVRYLGELQARYDDLRLVLAAYNAGEKAVDRYGGIPPYSETQEYVYRVGKRFGDLRRMAQRRAPVAVKVAKAVEPEYRPLHSYVDADGRLSMRTK